MTAPPLAILSTGLVTSVGLSATAACAAIRAGVANATETAFMDSYGARITAHQVQLDLRVRGRARLAQMASMAIAECLDTIPKETHPRIPLLLCVAERERPGRCAGLEDQLVGEIQQSLQIELSDRSLVIPHGRVGVAVALMHARRLLADGAVPGVLIAASDSLLSWPTLSFYEHEQRLLTAANSNGFMPGEAAGALLVGRAQAGPQLLCTGLGFATESAHIASDEPLRGEGLMLAVRGALADAGCLMHEIDFRISDLAGEQYYFKEAALAVARTLRVRKEEFDLWHPAECIGETGAAAGLAALVVADAACRKGYAKGPAILFHAANDSGQRSAAVLRFQLH